MHFSSPRREEKCICAYYDFAFRLCGRISAICTYYDYYFTIIFLPPTI